MKFGLEKVPWVYGLSLPKYGPYCGLRSVFSDAQNRMFLAFYDQQDTGRIVVYGLYLMMSILGRMLHFGPH